MITRRAAAMATAAATAVLFVAGEARADVLVRADGKRVDGVLVTIDTTTVHFRPEKGGAALDLSRAEVAGVLFYERAKDGSSPDAGALDRVEGDSLSLDGDVVRVERSEFSHFGITKLLLRTQGGALQTLITPRRIGAISFAGAAKKSGGRVPPAKPAVFDPVKLGAATETLLRGVRPTADVPAAVFAGETVLPMVTDAEPRDRLTTALGAARAMLPEHTKKRWSLGKVEVDKYRDDLPAGGGEQFGHPEMLTAGREGFYVFSHILTTTGELIGAKIRIAWRTKDDKVGCVTHSYSTRVPMKEHVVAKGVLVGQSKVERVAVILLDGDEVLDVWEGVVGKGGSSGPTTGTPWWKNASEWNAAQQTSTANVQTLEEHKTTQSVWEDFSFGPDSLPPGIPPFPTGPGGPPDGK